MKKILVLLTLFVALSLNTFAQFDLPEGATQRIGKGAIWEIGYSPDGKILAVASSIGTWLYDAQTGVELNSTYRTHLREYQYSVQPRWSDARHWRGLAR